MRTLGYRWRVGELAYAIRYWGTIALVYLAVLAALVVVAHRWPW